MSALESALDVLSRAATMVQEEGPKSTEQHRRSSNARRKERQMDPIQNEALDMSTGKNSRSAYSRPSVIMSSASQSGRMRNWDTMNMPPQSTFNMPSTSSYNMPSTSSYNMPSTSSYNMPSTSSYNMPSTSSYNMPPPPSYNMPSTSSYNMPSTSSYNMPSTSSYNMPSTSSYNMPSTSSYNMPSTSKSNFTDGRRKGNIYDPAVDEHFKRSLGAEKYAAVFHPTGREKEVGLSVDDHFAKSLGDQWATLKQPVGRSSTPSPMSAPDRSRNSFPSLHCYSTNSYPDHFTSP